MQQPELFKLHTDLTTQAYALIQAKNTDYGKKKDIFHSLRRHGLHGICVRLNDKLSRLESFEEKGFNAVKDESVKDTILDIINYAVLFYAYHKETTDPIVTEYHGVSKEPLKYTIRTASEITEEAEEASRQQCIKNIVMLI